MKTRNCAQCGAEIDNDPVSFRGRDFCNDECCDEFEAGAGEPGGPADDDLDDDFDDDFDEDDFDDDDFDDLDDEDDDDFDDDDFRADPDEY